MHAGNMTHPREHAFRKAMRIARQKLERGVTDNPARELGHRALQARARHLRGEQQRNPSGDSHNREALLHQARAQTHAVEMQGIGELHRYPPSILIESLPSLRPNTRSA